MGEQTSGNTPGEDANIGWSVMSLLLSGTLTWGGIGWLVDRWVDTKVFTPTGFIVGFFVAVYLVMVRYGEA